MNKTTFILLFCISTVFAYAGNPLSHYAANAYRFNKEFPQEKVYLHFDNTSYITGDTVWFKAYVVNASDLTASKSVVLYVDLLNAAGSVMKQQKFKIVDGQAEVFTPSGKHSRVRFETEDGIIGKFELPDAVRYGHTLNIACQTNDSLKLKIMSSTEPGNIQDSLGLAIMCRGRLLYFSQIPMRSSDGKMDISLSGIPEGVCQLCLYDRTGSPVSTRMFYRRTNMEVPQIDVSFNKSVYRPLEKVRLDVDITYKDKPISDNICLSVRDDDGHQGPYYSDLRTDLLLSSDLRGLVWKPEYYFECDDSIHAEALDLLCMVQGWERYDWKQMAGGTFLPLDKAASQSQVLLGQH